MSEIETETEDQVVTEVDGEAEADQTAPESGIVGTVVTEEVE